MSVSEQAQATSHGVQKAARKAHPLIEPLARLGYAAKGVIYGLVGTLAFMAASGNGGKATDQRGAVDTLASYPLGSGLLYALGAGLLGYALWRVIMGLFNPEGRGLIKRLGYTVTAFAYGGIGFSAFDAAGGSKTQGNEDESIALLMSLPLGRLLVAVIGLVFLVAAVSQVVNAAKAHFRSVLKLGEMSEAEERTLMVVGRVGLAARGFAFFLIGSFLIWAAYDNDPRAAGGLDEALKLLSLAPHGPLLLGAAGAGLIAYGVFMLFEARYRRITPA